VWVSSTDDRSSLIYVGSAAQRQVDWYQQEEFAVDPLSDSKAFLTREPIDTVQTLLDLSCDRARVADRYYTLPKATRGFVRDCLLPYSQLTSISEGRSPIRNLGTR